MKRATLLFTMLFLASQAIASPLRYAEDRSPAILNPLFATSMSDARIAELVFESLFTDDFELRASPLLAESFQIASDRKSMTIELRPNVKWHDGTHFTSADVVFTVAAMKNPETISTEKGRVAWIKEVKAAGKFTVELIFENEEYAPQDKLHFKLLPAHAFASSTVKRNDKFQHRPIGTGPYEVIGFNDDNSISLQAYPYYHDKTNLERLTMREVADKNYQAKLLMYESLEALVRVLPRDLATLQNNRSIDLYPYQTNSWWYLGFNMKDERFKENAIREAIHALIDTEELLRPIGTGDLLSGPYVKSSPYYNHDVPRRKPDHAKASTLLQEAGYKMEGHYWVKDGKILHVRLATPKNLDTAQDVVINLQAQLQNQGIRVEPVFLDEAEWKAKVWKNRDFDLILSQWSFDRNEDIYDQFHSEGTRNFVGYASAEVDDLLTRARDARDPQEKKQLMRAAHKAIANDTPMVFLWTLDTYSALSVKVRNVVVHPFYFFTWVRAWYLR